MVFSLQHPQKKEERKKERRKKVYGVAWHFFVNAVACGNTNIVSLAVYLP